MIKYIVIIFTTSLLFYSCKTTKYIDKVKTVVDSTAINQRDALVRVLKEEIDRFEKEREQWENTGVTFETTPCPDSTKTVTKIIFDNGKIKSIEGNVKALNQSLYEKSAELYDAHSLIDSLTLELEKSETKVAKTEVRVIKDIETKWYLPWWIWLIVGGSVIIGGFPYMKRFFKSKFNI